MNSEPFLDVETFNLQLFVLLLKSLFMLLYDLVLLKEMLVKKFLLHLK